MSALTRIAAIEGAAMVDRALQYARLGYSAKRIAEITGIPTPLAASLKQQV